MIEYFNYIRKIHNLKKEISRINFLYAKDLKAAAFEKTATAVIREIEEQRYHETRLYQDEIDQLQSGRLCGLARSMQVPIPTDDDSWYESNWIGGRALTVKGFADLRAAIRKEQTERWSYWEVRIKVLGVTLTATTGAAGALIGLIAVWKK